MDLDLDDSSAGQSQGPHKRGRRKGDTIHPVHNVFSFHEERNESHCLASGCTASIPGRHAGNLMSHLKRHHKSVYETVVKERRENIRDPAGAPKAKRACLNGVRLSGEALQLHCLRLITEHGLSFKTLDYSAFQDIVTPILQALPANERFAISSHTIPAKISGLANKVRTKLAKEMDGMMTSVQVDGCTKNYRHFIGVNVQYVKDGKLALRTLAVEEIFMSSTALNLKSVIIQVLKRYRLPVKSIVSFTSDNGQNYVLAGRLLAAQIDEDETVCSGDGATDVQDEGLGEMNIELQQDEFKLQSIRCAAHTLQLSVADTLNSCAMIKPTLEAVRKLANYLRNENQYMQIRTAGLHLPTLDVVTRWGSTYDMLKSIHMLKNFMELTLKITPRDKATYFLSVDQWEQVESILEDLAPIRRATSKLQAHDLSLGQFFAIWSQLKMILEKKQTTLSQEMLKSMIERAKSVNYRSKGRGEKQAALFNYPAFNAAVFLDPRFFSVLDANQIADAKSYLLDLWQRLMKLRSTTLLSSSDTNAIEESTSEDEQPTPPADEDNSFEVFLQLKNKERQSKVSATSVGGSGSSRAKISSLLDEYDRTAHHLPPAADVHQYWETRRLVTPELYELAKIVLAIPATQVSVERLFSSLRFILRPQRFGLKNENVDDVAFLHANASFLREMAQEIIVEPPAANPGASSPGSSTSFCD